MDTLSWLNYIKKSTFETRKHVIEKCLYTSRVHDLIDLSLKGNQLAQILLKRLADRTPDEDERKFLLGKKSYISFENDTLRNYRY